MDKSASIWSNDISYITIHTKNQKDIFHNTNKKKDALLWILMFHPEIRKLCIKRGYPSGKITFRFSSCTFEQWLQCNGYKILGKDEVWIDEENSGNLGCSVQ